MIALAPHAGISPAVQPHDGRTTRIFAPAKISARTRMGIEPRVHDQWRRDAA